MVTTKNSGGKVLKGKKKPSLLVKGRPLSKGVFRVQRVWEDSKRKVTLSRREKMESDLFSRSQCYWEP